MRNKTYQLHPLPQLRRILLAVLGSYLMALKSHLITSRDIERVFGLTLPFNMNVFSSIIGDVSTRVVWYVHAAVVRFVNPTKIGIVSAVDLCTATVQQCRYLRIKNSLLHYFFTECLIILKSN